MKYYQIQNPGTKGWITHQDNELAHIANLLGDIYMTENEQWAVRVGAIEKTEQEAQAIIDAATNQASGSNDILP